LLIAEMEFGADGACQLRAMIARSV